MKNSVKIGGLLLSWLLGLAGPAPAQQLVSNGFAMPESVTSNGRRFFVSNQGQDPFSKDGDGFISEIDAQGKVLARTFAPRTGVLHAPKGLAIVGETLYVADLDRVVGFSLATGQTVFELPIAHATALNDVCALSGPDILVSETASGTIYRIDTQAKTCRVLATLPLVNGLKYLPATRQLVACTVGQPYGTGGVFIQNLADPSPVFRALPNLAQGFFDGIEVVDSQHLLISDWVAFPVRGFGKLWLYDLQAQSAELLLSEESPADLYYDQASGRVYLPQMLHNRVLIATLPQLRQASQQLSAVGYHQLYHYGTIGAFVNGLYQGSLPVAELKLHGDFGLGAPDQLDGELTLLHGRAYQTQAIGTTREVPNTHLTAFAAVNFFEPGRVLRPARSFSRATLLHYLDSLLGKQTGLYAIHVRGQFAYVKTRAFPPARDARPLATLLGQQRFFERRQVAGDLVGYRLPAFLEGIDAAGYHFHFLSEAKDAGGHVLDFTATAITLEIDELTSFSVAIPQLPAFEKFGATGAEKSSIRQVESGGKP